MSGRTLPKTLTRDEGAALMAMPNLDAPTGLRDRCAMELMYRAGLRVSEVCGLHVRDVDWSEGFVRIRPEVAKYGREAVLPLDPPTLDLLKRWKGARRPYAAKTKAPELFVTLRGRPLDRRNVWEMVARRARKAGIDRPVWPHMLRHSFATDLLADKFNVREVQRLMRHERLETTATYLEIRDEELAARVRERRR